LFNIVDVDDALLTCVTDKIHIRSSDVLRDSFALCIHCCKYGILPQSQVELRSATTIDRRPLISLLYSANCC